VRIAVAVAFLLAASPAFAQGDDDDDSDAGVAPTVPSLDCAIGKTPIVSGKVVQVLGAITCTAANAPSADVWIVQDGAAGEHHKGTPQIDAFLRGSDFKACKDFEIHADLGGGEIAPIAVTTKCKKARKLSAKLSCNYLDKDGNAFAWPGNGAKKKPPLDDALACWIVGGKGDGLTATIAGHAEPMWTDDDTGAWSSEEVLDEGVDFTRCESFAVVASVENEDGQVVFAQKLAIVQACP
jgi:hypothetical protein